VRIILPPDKANPPLIVYSDRVLTAAITFQRFEAVRWWYAQVSESPRVVQDTQLPQCDLLNVMRQPAAALACPDRRRLAIMKADDHSNCITA
jgi:hypothetical protein